MKIKNIDRINNILKYKEDVIQANISQLKTDLGVVESFKEIVNKDYEKEDLNVSEIIFELLKDLPLEKQKEILKDCGLAPEMETKIIEINNLDLVIDNIRKKYGEEVKHGSWVGIKDTIQEEEKRLNTTEETSQ